MAGRSIPGVAEASVLAEVLVVAGAEVAADSGSGGNFGLRK